MTQGRRVDKTAAGFGVIKTGAKKTTKLAIQAAAAVQPGPTA